MHEIGFFNTKNWLNKIKLKFKIIRKIITVLIIQSEMKLLI